MSPTTSSSTRFTSLVNLVDRGASRDDIAAYMNDLTPRKRVDEALSITGKRQAKLFEAVAGGPELTLQSFVPDDVTVGRTLIFEGRNSLPMFTRFQKRFARVESGQVVGYNHQTWAFVTGPGFFVVKEGQPGARVLKELYLDYTDVPKEVPAGWPQFKPNEAGLSLLVYANMKDYMREIATNAYIGAAFKRGKAEDKYFILARPGD
ncbi:MAG: hypothetical protein JRI68_01335 [Deltaproteobacteria bacterium]|nr:hypothetical protein [Deltaproteobacteria bacterium]